MTEPLLKPTPMLWVMLSLMGGVVAKESWGVSLALSFALFVLSCGVWLAARHRVAFLAIIATFAMVLTSISLSPSALKPQRGARLLLRTESQTRGVVMAIERDGEWIQSDTPIRLGRAASLYQPHRLLLAQGNVVEIDESSSKRYSLLFVVDRYLGDYPLELLPHRISLSDRANRWALERLQRLSLNPYVFATAAAMTFGEREGISKELNEAYIHSGTSHLLAISGMHLGIFFLIIRFLTHYLPLLRYGHIIRNVVSILAVWIFAFMAGLGDSVMRAAWMFTLFELSKALSREYSSLNSLCMAITIIVVFDPYCIYDASLMLSALSVAAIILWAVPLCNRLRSGYVVVDAPLCSLVMGLSATIVTAPLITHNFGYLALLGPVTTLLLIYPLTIIICCSLIWVALPFEPLKPLLDSVITSSTIFQNHLVKWFDSWNLGYIKIETSTLSLIAIYTLFATMTYLAYKATEKRRRVKDESKKGEL